MSRFSLAMWCAGTAILLGGCGPDPAKPAAGKVSPAPVPVPAPLPAAAPIEGSENTLAEGIHFEKPAYPKFIRSVEGMWGGPEEFGRWTVGPRALFVFAQPLPASFTLRIEVGGAFGPNVGKRQLVKVGDWQDQFEVGTSSRTFEFKVKTRAPADAIEFVVAQPTTPKSLGLGNDPRSLGFSLRRLVVTPG